jgi:hypothetical protein
MLKKRQLALRPLMCPRLFKLKIQTAQFPNFIGSLDAKHKKKAKKCVGFASYDTWND